MYVKNIYPNGKILSENIMSLSKSKIELSQILLVMKISR